MGSLKPAIEKNNTAKNAWYTELPRHYTSLKVTLILLSVKCVIKPQRITLVKVALAALAVTCIAAEFDFGDERGSRSEPELPLDLEYNEEKSLPEIEARTFAVNTQRRSISNRVYLFNDVTDAKTRPGKILLLRKENANVMAFRVLKTYPDKKQFAATVVKKYPDIEKLEVESSFLGIEKVADVFPPPTPEQNQQDALDIGELESAENETNSGTEVDTSDLDDGLVPPKAGPLRLDEDELEPDDMSPLVVEEVNEYDVDSHWLSTLTGISLNSARYGGGVAYYMTGGLRYGLSLGSMVFLSGTSLQDSIVLEASASIYKVISDFVIRNDGYTVMPVEAAMRYNILFGENLSLFFYFGWLRNFVLAATTDEGYFALSTGFPAGGGGLMFRIGPKWHIRFDIGYEMTSGGLVLRF